MKPFARSVLQGLRPRSVPPGPAQFPTLTHRIMAPDSGVFELEVKSESDWWVYNEVFVDHEYDAAVTTALEGIAPRARFLVVDLGANAGYFAARAAQLWRGTQERGVMTLIMVEGSPTVFADLQERHGQSPLPEVDARLVHGLVGARTGRAELAEVPFGARNTLFAEHNRGIMPPDQMTRHSVPFVDLDVVVPDGVVDLLKVDVEGSEMAVLETYVDTLLTRVRVAVIEFHHQLVDVEGCFRLLSAAGLNPVGQHDPMTTDTSLMVFRRDVPTPRPRRARPTAAPARTAVGGQGQSRRGR